MAIPGKHLKLSGQDTGFVTIINFILLGR